MEGQRTGLEFEGGSESLRKCPWRKHSVLHFLLYPSNIFKEVICFSPSLFLKRKFHIGENSGQRCSHPWCVVRKETWSLLKGLASGRMFYALGWPSSLLKGGNVHREETPSNPELLICNQEGMKSIVFTSWAPLKKRQRCST